MRKENSRFDYIKFNEESTHTQNQFKVEFEIIEGMINASLGSARDKELALTKLEEAYMWIGKAIKNDQISCQMAKEMEVSS